MFWGLKESEILLAEVRKKQNCRFLLRSGCYSTVGVQLGTEYSTVSLYSTVSFVSGAGCRESSMAGGKDQILLFGLCWFCFGTLFGLCLDFVWFLILCQFLIIFIYFWDILWYMYILDRGSILVLFV